MNASFDVAKLNNPLYTVRCLGQGLKLLARPELRHFVWIPLLINFVLFALGLWAVRHYFDAVIAYFLPDWLMWLRGFIWPLVATSFVILTLFSFTLLANIVGAPFYGILAEKVAVLLGLPAVPEVQEPWPKAVLRSLQAETARLRYYLVRAAPMLLLFLIPGVNVFASFLWLAFNGWFLALEYTSYPLERYGCGFAEQRQLLGKARIMAAGFGVLVALGLAVPLLNVLMPPAAVAGAVIYIAGARRAD
ncbi:MAG: sulfate transporter CysZ [Methylococcaceae bacterium]|nr:MAG: sulfate transporter CysZ [Methylococcaceae bacterium]